MGRRFRTGGPRGRFRRASALAASHRLAPPGGEPTNASNVTVREPWALKTTDTLRPGERGTKRLTAQYGDRLVCVRYRCDPANRKRYKTAELIVAEADWEPPPGPEDLVRVRVAFDEEALRRRLKEAGGRWRPESKTWEMTLRAVEELGLRGRIVAV